MNNQNSIKLGFLERLPLPEQINFTRHLGIIVKAGLPILESLRIIRQQSTSKTLTKIINQLIIDVNEGHLLSDGLARYQHIFGDFFINIIRVGESSGTLAQNLFYLAEELKKSRELRSKVRSAMVYPAVVLVATLTLTSFLTFFVFPKILPVFSNLNIELPATTKFMIGFLNFMKAYVVHVAIGFILGLIVLRTLIKKVPTVRYMMDQAILHLPVVGRLVMSVNMGNFTRILALLLKSGIKIDEAVKTTADTFSNSVYSRYFAGAGDIIRKGEQLADYLALKPKLFPQLLTGIVKIGENTGNLEENLNYLSEYYTEEVDSEIGNMTNLLEPLMLLFMGTIVGFVALSIITPIYSISQGVG